MQMYLATQSSQWNPTTASRERMALPPINLVGASSTARTGDYQATPVMMMIPPTAHRPMMMSPNGIAMSPAFGRPQTSCSPALSKKRIRTIPNATKSITLDLLRPHFDRPLAEVAAMFGICMTLMKKICRKNGVPRWPHRQIRGLRKSIWSIEKALRSCDSEAQRRSYIEHLDKQKDKLAAILRGPDGPGKGIFHELVMSVPCSPMSELATPKGSNATVNTPSSELPATGYSSPLKQVIQTPRDIEAGACQTPTITRLPSIASLLAVHAAKSQQYSSPRMFQC